MNRLLSILVSLVVLFFLYLWISHLSTSPKYLGGSDEAAALTEETIREEPETIIPEAESDQEVSDMDVSEDAPEPPPPAEQQDPVDTEQKAEDIAPPAVEETVVEPERSDPVSSGSLTHWVIAGNFLELSNAQRHLRRMKELGYSQAEIVRFELSEYHTVCAGKFSDVTEARRVSRKITESHGIDTYVRQVNQ